LSSVATSLAANTGIAVANAGPGGIRIARGIAIDLDAFEAFANENDIRQTALDAFFAIVHERDVPLDQVEKTLRDIADRFLHLRAQLQRIRPQSDLPAMWQQASDALEDGDLDQAESLLRELHERELANVEALVKELDHRKRNAATALAGIADLNLMRLDFVQAAQTYQDAIDELPNNDPLAMKFGLQYASAARYAGDFKGAKSAADAVLLIVGNDDHASNAQVWQERAFALRELAQYDKAAQALEKATQHLRAQDDQSGLFMVTVHQARLAIDRGALDQAATILDGLATRAHHRGDGADENLAQIYHTLGRLWIEKRDWMQAETALQEALKLQELMYLPRHPDVLRTICDLGYMARQTGRFQKAQTLYNRAADGFQAIYAENHPEYVTLLDHMAGLAVDMGDHGKAAALFERAIALGADALGADHPDMAQSWNNLALLRQETGDVTGAVAALQKAASIFETTVGADHPDAATAWHNLAGAYIASGDVESARHYAANAHASRRRIFGANHDAVADSLMQNAIIAQREGDIAQSLSEQRKAHNMLTDLHGSAHVKTLQAGAHLAQLEHQAGEKDQALQTSRLALFHARRLKARNPGLLAQILNNLGQILFAAGRARRGQCVLSAGLAASQEKWPDGHADVMLAFVNYAAVAVAAGDSDAGDLAYEQAIDLGQRLWPEGHALTAIALNNHAKRLETSGRTDDVTRLYQQAVDILQHVCGRDHDQTKAVRKNAERWQQLREEV